MVRDELLKLLKLDSSDLNHPANIQNGDFSTNIALKRAKELKKNPKEVAEEFVGNIPKNNLIEKIDIIDPGFINFYISKKILLEEVQMILSDKENYGKSDKQKLKILLEFGQPNTHKVPHIGHLFSYIYGESLARILQAAGRQLNRINYQGDVGLHVAKCLYIVRKKISKTKKLRDLEEKVGFLQECYQEGAKLYEEDKNAQDQIDQLNKQIYQKDKEIIDLWEETRQWSLDYYQEFEKKLDIKFDKNYFESETSVIGKKIVDENVEGVFEKSDGAIIFRGEKYDLHTRVFITKFGVPTYETKDIGLMYLKKNDFPFDLSIVTTASEQNEYWRVIIKASEILFPQLEGKLKHIGYGLINLVGGKMSSRTGQIIGVFDLTIQVKNEIKKEFKTDDQLSDKVTLASIKYSFLKSEASRNIIFDIKNSIAKEGDSGPYLLYTYVRTRSILEKITNYELRITNSVQMNDEELTLLRLLYQFPEIVENAANFYSPHLIAHFLFSLAQTFNLFYQKNPVIKAEGESKQLRILLTAAVSQVIKNGLYLLGIETVEKM